jgi:hypothetical protein
MTTARARPGCRPLASARDLLPVRVGHRPQRVRAGPTGIWLARSFRETAFSYIINLKLYNVLYCFIMFYSFNFIFIIFSNFKKILLKKHVWSFCMGSLGPMESAPTGDPPAALLVREPSPTIPTRPTGTRRRVRYCPHCQ